MIEEAKDEGDEDPPSNEVYMWGDDSRGQLGVSGVFGESQYFAEPQVCSFGIVIKLIACGEYHTIFTSDNMCVYSMGCNKYGQLGIGD